VDVVRSAPAGGHRLARARPGLALCARAEGLVHQPVVEREGWLRECGCVLVDHQYGLAAPVLADRRVDVVARKLTAVAPATARGAGAADAETVARASGNDLAGALGDRRLHRPQRLRRRRQRRQRRSLAKSCPEG